MSTPRNELTKGAVAATDARRQGKKDSQESSRGESSKEGASKGESSNGESSKGASWLRLGNRGREARDAGRKFFSLYRESSYEESESETAFEMQPITRLGEDTDKLSGKEKKKADKGKAIYRDPRDVNNQDVKVEKKRREVEPKEDEGESSGLLGALAKLRLDCDEYQEELEHEHKLERQHEQKPRPKSKQKQKQKLEEAKRRRVHIAPYHEAEDGWMVVRENLDVWDFTEEVGRVLPD